MSKKARSEGARVAALVRSSGSPYFVADVDLEDNEADVFASADACRKTLGKKVTGSYMIISAGTKQLTAVANMHESKDGVFSAKDWVVSSILDIIPEMDMNTVEEALMSDSTDLVAKATVKADTPFKLKDLVRAQAFAKLREAGQIEEEEEEEELYGLDDF
jgi:hypothetical protein